MTIETPAELVARQKRIRLITARVKVLTTTGPREEVVSLRFPWTGPSPAHGCHPHRCVTCVGSAQRKAERRVGVSCTPTTVEFLRDRQAVNR